MKMEPFDPLAPARGIFNGCLLALVFWALAAACVVGGVFLSTLVR